MHYSVQPRNLIFVKDCRFLGCAKNMGSNIGKNMSKNLNSKYRQKPLDHAEKKQLQMSNLAQNEQFKKQQKQMMIWLVKKLLLELKKFPTIHKRIIQKQLQMKMIKKYLKNDIYLQKKDRILLLTKINIIV